MKCPEKYLDFKFNLAKNSDSSLNYFVINEAKNWSFTNYLEKTHLKLDRSKLTRIRHILSNYKNDLQYLKQQQETPPELKDYLKFLKKEAKLTDLDLKQLYLTDTERIIQHQPIIVSGDNTTVNQYNDGNKKRKPVESSDSEGDQYKKRYQAKNGGFGDKFIEFMNLEKKDFRPFSPLAHNIIRCGNGVSGRPDVPKDVYAEHLVWHNKETTKEYPFSGKYNKYINSVVDAASIDEFSKNINNINDSAKEFLFIQRIFRVMEKVYITDVKINTSESTFNYYMIHPLLEIVSELIRWKTKCGFFPGEIALCAMKKVRKEDEKDYLADALFKFFDFNTLEVLLLETSGAYGNTSSTKFDFDNHKAMYGLLSMLKEIASTYKFARIECFYNLKIYFIQAANKSLYLWSLRYLEGDLYEMWREEKIQLDDNFNNKDSIIPMIQFLWNLKGRLEDLAEHLKLLKEDHDQIKKSYRFSKEEPVFLTDFVNPKPMKLTESKHSIGMSKYGPFSSPEHD